MVRIAPSILSADFAHLADEVARVETCADLLHVDVMDGHFVPNMTVGPPVVASLRAATRLPLDVHLMIANPDAYVGRFAEAGASLITVHAEATPHLHRTLQAVKGAGVKAGVAICPATPIHCLEYVLDLADLVLVMTVNPGFGGQEFIGGMQAKVRQVRALIEGAGSRADIEVDGGICDVTAPLVVRAGANVLVAGSSVFGGGDPCANIERLRRSALSALPSC
ncbi:MAG: ribulose-phosphate 3-epimerase [Clostridia bacterium]